MSDETPTPALPPLLAPGRHALTLQQKLFWLLAYLAFALIAVQALTEKFIVVVHVRGLLYDPGAPAEAAPVDPAPTPKRLGFSLAPVSRHLSPVFFGGTDSCADGNPRGLGVTTSGARPVRAGAGATAPILEINPTQEWAARSVHNVIRDGRERGSESCASRVLPRLAFFL